jgi:hypothetical protein
LASQSSITVVQAFGLLLAGIWTVAVWAWCGGAITRSAALQLALGRPDHLGKTMRFAAKKWRSFFTAPLVPLGGAILVAVPIAIVGLLLRTNLTTLLAALLWPLLLIGGFLIALLLLGLIFGWPLLWANLGTEGIDAFDAVSRMYNYVFQRPLHYLFYVLVAGGLGCLGWVVVWYFVGGVLAATDWAVSWGAGADNVNLLTTGTREGFVPTVGNLGAGLIWFWCQGVRLLGMGFLISYFWTASAAIYSLLRRSVDGTTLDEVAPEEEDAEEPAPLPPVRADSAGAPILDDGQKQEEKPAEA